MTTNSINVSSLVDGRRLEPSASGKIDIISPNNGKHLFSYATGSSADVDLAVQSSRQAFDDGRWTQIRPSVRKALLFKFADLIEEHSSELDALDATEMGKPLSVAFCNAREGAQFVRFCAEGSDKIVGDVLASDQPSTVLIRPVPRGVVAGFASWNFPAFVALLKAAPALAMANTVILKPSEYAPRSALRLAELALEAGIPPGVLNVVVGTGEGVGKSLALHDDIDMITFTGSTQVGKLMLRYSAESNLKKVLVECGGKSPHVVFNDGIDPSEIAPIVAGSILANQGQICAAGTRLLVHQSVERDLVERLRDIFGGVVIGDSLDPQTTFGPISTRRHFDRIERFINGAVQSGTGLVCGGRRALPETGGNFIEPAIFTGVDPQSPLAREEIFGPVLAVTSFQSEDEAVALANSTDFGLSATVWTSRLSTGMSVAKRINSSVAVRAGAISTEGARFNSSSEPAAQSGLGVEGGMAGLESYVRRQTVTIIHG